MKTRTIAIAVGLWLVAGVMAFGADPNMGTWKLNEAKSKIPAMAPKNNTVVYEASGDNIRVTVDGTDGQGKPSHNEWTGKFDGKDYTVDGKTPVTRWFRCSGLMKIPLSGLRSGMEKWLLSQKCN